MLSDNTFDTLRSLSSVTLRSFKAILADAKGGTTEYFLFRAIDRVLLDREGVIQFNRKR